MGPGAEIVGRIDEIPDLHTVHDPVHHIQRVFISVRMGDAEDLLFRLDYIVTHEVNQRIERLFPSPLQAVLHNKSVAVAAEDRLHLEQVADHRRRAVETACAGQVFQIIDRECPVHAVGGLCQNVSNLSQRISLILQLTGVDRKNSLGKRRIKRIHQSDFTLRILLSKLLRSNTSSVKSTAYVAA